MTSPLVEITSHHSWDSNITLSRSADCCWSLIPLQVMRTSWGSLSRNFSPMESRSQCSQALVVQFVSDFGMYPDTTCSVSAARPQHPREGLIERYCCQRESL